MVKSWCHRNPRAQDSAIRFYEQWKSLFLRLEIQGLSILKGKWKFLPLPCHLGMPRSWIWIMCGQDTAEMPNLESQNHPISWAGQTHQDPGTPSCFLQEKTRIKCCSLAGKGPDLAMGRGRAPAGASRARICCSELLSLGIWIMSRAGRKTCFVTTAETGQ